MFIHICIYIYIYIYIYYAKDLSYTLVYQYIGDIERGAKNPIIPVRRPKIIVSICI
jgi:hypothetical protein